MEYTAKDTHQLSVDKFIGRACTLLLILFCLIAIIGYLELPFDIPVHVQNGLPDRFANKAQVFIVPAMGMALYVLMGFVEKYIYLPNRKLEVKNAAAYYKSISKFIGVFKLLILFSGIIATTAFIHHTLNIDGDYGLGYKVLGGLVIAVPVIFMMNEIINMKKALVAKQ